MNVTCPYHQQERPACVLIDVSDQLGGQERVHTQKSGTPNTTEYLVWQPPLRTNAVCYGDRIVTQPLEDHLVPSVVLPGNYFGAFGRLRSRQRSLRVLNNLTTMGFVVAWDSEHFGLAFPKDRPELGDRLLDLHATGQIQLDERYIDAFRHYLDPGRRA
jgi:hypothetical protein